MMENIPVMGWNLEERVESSGGEEMFKIRQMNQKNKYGCDTP